MGMIIDFQKKYGLVPDGKIGKITLSKIKEVLNIATNEQLANFMGQCDHESEGFTLLYENLNYSATSLLKTWPRHFTQADALKYQHNQQMIANRAYANRDGNGNEASGDGWLHKGVGPIQLTGKINQDAFANYIKDPAIKTNPSLIATKYPFESAKFYFDNGGLWKYAKGVDVNSITILSKIINVGNATTHVIPKGLDDRIERTQYYFNLITK